MDACLTCPRVVLPTIPRGLPCFVAMVLTMTCHVFAAMADELRQLISGPQSVPRYVRVTPTVRIVCGAVSSGCRCDAQPPVWSRLPASRTAQESAMTKVWERPSEPRILEVHAMQRFVGAGSLRLSGRLCLAGSPQTHMAVDLKAETNDSGIWDYPMSICYLWSWMPWSTWKVGR